MECELHNVLDQYIIYTPACRQLIIWIQKDIQPTNAEKRKIYDC